MKSTILGAAASALFLCATASISADGSTIGPGPSPAELQRLVDMEELRQLHLDYAAAQETLDLDRLMALFTDDVVLEYPAEYGGTWGGGREVIRRNFEAAMKSERLPFNALYVLTNPQIHITGPNTAHGRWTFTNYLTAQSEGDAYTTVGGPNQPIYLLGMYEDEYRKVDGRWKIARLKLTLFWPTRNYTGLAHP